MKWGEAYKDNPPRDRDFDNETLRRRLTETWSDPAGLLGWFMSVDHKSIAKRYMITAFLHLIFAGLLAMTIRAQLMFPGLRLLSPDLYNQFFTMHGTVMMFLFAVPMVEAMMIYLVPLMVGTRMIAFPRLNAFSYWVYLYGGLFVWIAFLMNNGPDAGWFSYVPLAGPEFGAGKRSDVYAQMITFTEVAGLAVAVEVIVTILKFRAPGMRLHRMPVFVWASLITSIMVIWSMPSIVTTSTFLILDRLVGTHFFNQAEGGDPLLWQHLFWYFAHPEVYIIFLPSVALASHVVETFSGRPMFGYPAIVLSMIAQGLLSFGLWVHHMYATGLPRVGNTFFEASSISIAIPSGTFVFCWLATLWSGRPRLQLPLLWIVTFFALFLAGGFSGVMLGAVPIDLQLTDSYVLPSHLHFVLMGGAVAPLIAAAWFWYPKITGRLLNPALGYPQWALFLLGSLVTFSAMFILGLNGMTRRVYTYPHDVGWTGWNVAASVGAWAIGLSFLLFAINLVRSLRHGERASDNPWDAAGLEWSLTSPPPVYNYDRVPEVRSRSPLWEEESLDHVVGLRVDEREVLVTDAYLAEPEMREPGVKPTLWPFVCASVLSVVLVASIYTPQAITWGILPVGLAFLAWLYPREHHAPKPEAA